MFFSSSAQCLRSGEGCTRMGCVACLWLVTRYQLQSQEQIQAGMFQVLGAMTAFKERGQEYLY